MTEKKGTKGAGSVFKDSFKINRRLGMVIVWEICLIVAVVIGVFFWAKAMNTLTPLIDDVVGPLTLTGTTTFEQQFLMSNAVPAAMKLKKMSIIYSSLALIYLLLVFSFFKAKTYFTIRKKSLTKMLYLKFIGLFALWNAVLLAASFGLQVLIHKTLYFKVTYSVGARIGIVVIGMLFLQIIIYLTVILFSLFAKKGEFVESFIHLYRLAILKIHHFIKPILAVFLMFAVLNVLLLISRIAGPATPVVATLFVIIFGSWVKIYYAGIIDRIEGHTVKAHAVKVHTSHKTQTPKKVLKKVKTVKKTSSHSHSKISKK